MTRSTSAVSNPTRVAPCLALGLAAAAFAATGCSSDTHTYKSTRLAPITVDLVYINSGETAWTYEVPAGQMLTLDFDRKGEVDGFRAPAAPATSVDWFTVPLDTKVGLDGNPKRSKALQSDKVDLSGQPVKIVLSLRQQSESDDIPTTTGVDGLDVPPPQDLPEPEQVDGGELTLEEQIGTSEPEATDAIQTPDTPAPADADLAADDADINNAAQSGSGDDSELLEVLESGLGSKPNPATNPTK